MKHYAKVRKYRNIGTKDQKKVFKPTLKEKNIYTSKTISKLKAKKRKKLTRFEKTCIGIITALSATLGYFIYLTN